MMLLKKAISLAIDAHEGQADKLGNPYISHVFRVMGRLRHEDEQVVAALHDVVEDTPLTFKDLEDFGFPQEIIEAVDSVTRRRGESYDVFVSRAAQNRIGINVKIADLMDNSDPNRLSYLSEKDRQRLENKYRRALEFLIQARMAY